MKKPRLLIVGLGSIGERHLRCAMRMDRADVLACEINADVCRTVADRYGLHEAYDSFDEAFAAGPTAAIVCVPAHLHVALATRLAAAGVHLLIEKPLSTSLDGVDRLAEIARQQRVTVAVAYVYRCFPGLAAMREALLSGRFGRPVELVAVCGQNFPTYRPAYRDTYYANRATGGGAIQDALTHVLNAGEWLVGPIDRLVADAAHRVLDGVSVEDTAHVLARHGEVLGSYSLNQHQAPNEITLTVVCKRGTVRYELHENRWRWMTEPGNEWHDEPGPALERDDLFMTQLGAFFDAIEQGTTPLCTLDDGLQTLRANLAILASLHEARWTTT